MRTGEMGERNFLKSIEHLVEIVDGAKLGFDDDASDIPLTKNRHIVVNVDTFVGRTDWLPGMSEAQVGRKTAVMALSDIVAKGALPAATMLSLCVPEMFDAIAAQELVRGFSQYCLKSGVSFIGGDVGAASDVVLTGVAVGTVSPSEIVARSGAQVGDVVAVTGLFGLTACAYEILLHRRKAEENFRSRAVAAAYKPDIHYGFVSALAKKKLVTASMDSSDGLGITLHTIAVQSGVSILIEDLPVAKGVMEFSRNLYIHERKMVLEGGEEFILVLTIPKDSWEDALEIAREMHVPLTSIGQVCQGKGVSLETEEGILEIEPRGYDNFREWE
ncbi:MAG: thiamine-phosphate kinase [Promethearchaeota archaeon]